MLLEISLSVIRLEHMESNHFLIPLQFCNCNFGFVVCASHVNMLVLAHVCHILIMVLFIFSGCEILCFHQIISMALFVFSTNSYFGQGINCLWVLPACEITFP